MTYILIFLAKILENSLSTLRIILVSNGKKVIGAILQGLITLVWLWSAATVIININDDIYKIIFFILGSSIGSFLGSFIEEKIAIGNIFLTISLNKDKGYAFYNKYQKQYHLDILSEYYDKLILGLFIPRKIRIKTIRMIKDFDNNATIYSMKTILD